MFIDLHLCIFSLLLFNVKKVLRKRCVYYILNFLHGHLCQNVMMSDKYCMTYFVHFRSLPLSTEKVFKCLKGKIVTLISTIYPNIELHLQIPRYINQRNIAMSIASERLNITSNRCKRGAKYIQRRLKSNLYQWLIFWHIMNLVGLNGDR